MPRLRLTREQEQELIALAVDVIEPPPHERAQCEQFIANAHAQVKAKTIAGRVGQQDNRRRLGQMEKHGRWYLRLYREAYRDNPAWWRRRLPPKLPLLAIIKTQLRSPAPSNRNSFAQTHAVTWAAELLLQYGHRPSKTRGGKWAKLAAILAGTPDADLFNALTAHRGPARFRILRTRPQLPPDID
jgi:hypothetical protein